MTSADLITGMMRRDGAGNAGPGTAQRRRLIQQTARFGNVGHARQRDAGWWMSMISSSGRAAVVQTGPVAERVRVREIDDDEGR